METITLALKLTWKGERVSGEVKVTDGVAMTFFSNPTLARELYKVEKINSNPNSYFNSTLNSYVEKYPGMNAKEIIAKLKAELESQGGKLIQK